MSNEIVFYTNPQSRGRIVRWMLEEVGQPYRTEVLEYGGAMKSPEYLAINPMGKVPTITHGDQVVTECAAICLYLADAFPQAGLLPKAGRAAYYRWLVFAAGPVEAAIIDMALGVEVPAEKEAMVGYGNFNHVVDALESAYRKVPTSPATSSRRQTSMWDPKSGGDSNSAPLRNAPSSKPTSLDFPSVRPTSEEMNSMMPYCRRRIEQLAMVRSWNKFPSYRRRAARPKPRRMHLTQTTVLVGRCPDMRIGLMGFGRVGRQLYALACRDPRFDIVAISDIGDPGHSAAPLSIVSTDNRCTASSKETT